MAIRLKDEAALKAASATKLATARTINGTSFDGSANITTSNWGTARTITIGNTGKSVNGSGNISWSLSEIGAVGLASPAFTGTPTAPTASAGTNSTQLATTAFVTTAVNNKTSVTGNAGTATKLQTARTIFGKSFDGSGNVAGKGTVYGTYTATASARYSNGALEIRENGQVGSAQSDIGYAPQIGFHWGGRVGATLAMSSGGEFQFINQAGTGYSNVRAGTFTGALSGNATTATTLQTARTINGTSFNGSANITTANWGTARTLTIGDSGKSVNGSGNVSWTLAEIGASDRSLHKNNYVRVTVNGDADTYYPVLINFSKTAFPYAHLHISRSYSWTAPDTWNTATHRGGLTLSVRWTGDSAWGGNDKNIVVEEFNESYSNMVAGMSLSTSGLVVWLRGGGALYQLDSEYGVGMTAVVHLEGFTSGANVTYSPRENTSNVTNEISKKYHVRAGGVYDNNARVYSSVNPQTTITGNAGTATTLQTARTINGTSFNGSANITTANWGTARTITIGSTGKSVNGSGNVSWSLAEIGAAAASHTHTNLVSRGNVTAETGTATPAVAGLSMAQVYNNGYPTTYGNVITLNGIGQGQLLVGWSGTSGAHAPVYVRSKRDSADASWSGWAQVYTSANPQTTVSGNAGTATTLQTARTINGTSFNGSANITTANWGTARNIYVADSTAANTGAAVSVNGSANVTLKLPATIKAALTGNATTATTLQTARTINGTSFNGSANITTANWGTARTLTVGNTGKSVNGSGNISWSLAEIGAVGNSEGVASNLTVAKYLKFADYDDGTATIVNTYLRDGIWYTGFSQINAAKFHGTFNATGESQLNGHALKLTSANSGYSRIGYEASSEDTYISGAGNNWLRLKKDGSLTWKGQDVITAGGGTMTGTLTVKNTSSGVAGTLWSGTGGFVVQAEAGHNLHLGGNNSSTDMTFSADKIDIGKHMYTGHHLYLGDGKSRLASNVFSLQNVTDRWTNIYLGPASDGEARICAWGDVDSGYRPIRASSFIASGSGSTFTGNAVTMASNGVFASTAGYVVIRSVAGGNIYLQGGEVRAVKVNSTTDYVNFTANKITSGNVYMNGANSVRNDTRELYLAGTHESYPSYLGSLSLTADSGGGRFYSMSIYNRKYTASANVHVTSAGTVGYTSSARRYKLDIMSVEEDKPERILALEPRTWFDRTATEQYANYLTMKAKGRSVSLDDEDIPYLDRQNGLIAEEVEEAGLSQFVNYGDPDEDGNREVMGVQYDRLWVLLIPLVRDLKATVESQQSEINELKALLKEQVA